MLPTCQVQQYRDSGPKCLSSISKHSTCTCVCVYFLCRRMDTMMTPRTMRTAFMISPPQLLNSLGPG